MGVETMYGLKPVPFAGAKQAAEKLGVRGKMGRKHTSAAKAIIDSIGFVPGINPRPTARNEFFLSL
jgi:hypothetical protein